MKNFQLHLIWCSTFYRSMVNALSLMTRKWFADNVFYVFDRVYNGAKRTDASGLNVSWPIPSFLPSDFDRRGRISPWAVLKNLEVPRIGMNSPAMPQNKLGMLVATTSTFYKNFYEHVNSLITSQPLTGNCNVASVGKSSLAFCCTLNIGQQTETSSIPSSDQSTELICAIWHGAFVDKVTLKPAVLTTEEAMTLKNVSVPRPVDRVEIPAKPATGCHRTDLRAGHSDLDHLQHVNTFSLYRFALNGIDSAAKQGLLGTDFPNDDRNVHKISSLHIREVFAGDFLQAHVWKIDSNTVGCQLERDNTAVAKYLVSYY